MLLMPLLPIKSKAYARMVKEFFEQGALETVKNRRVYTSMKIFICVLKDLLLFTTFLVDVACMQPYALIDYLPLQLGATL